MKRKIIAAVISLCMVCAACVALVACVPTEQKAQTYVSMDINPSIELTLDANDKVVSVRGANEDGQVLLYGEADLVGLKVEDATEKITQLAIELGYLDEDNKVVQTNVVGDKRVEDILLKVNAQVTATAESLNVSVNCTGADAFSLARKLDNLKAQYPQNQAIQSLTPSKLKLVVSASETGEVSIEAAAEMDVSELVKLVSDAHAEMKEYATAAYSKAKATAEGAFAKAQTAAIDGIYTTYFATHYPMELYYAAAYQGYKVSAVTTNALADMLFYAEQACDYPLDKEQIAAISEALGLGSDTTCLENNNGEITIRSIEAYADKTFKNSDANAALEEVKTKLTEALNTAESAIQQKIDEFNAKYQSELEEIKNMLTAAVSKMQGVLSNLVPDNIKQQIDLMVNDMKDIVSEIAEIVSDGKIRSDEVRALAKELDGKAKSSRDTMESKLTDDDRAAIENLQQKAEATLSGAKAQLDSAIAQAEEQAKAYLQQLKGSRASK